MDRQWIAHRPGGPETWAFDTVDTAPPATDEVTIRVRAAGVNPADVKHVQHPRPGLSFPVPIGYEVSGELVAVGDGAVLASGERATVGDEVIAFRVQGGYATQITVPSQKVLRKPGNLSHAEAANLLLAGTTAAEMLAVVEASRGETILLHGASGAVGVAVIQLARREGLRVIGTASPTSFDRVTRFGAEAVAYGDGLLRRLHELVGETPFAAALDAVGTDEALDVSEALVHDRRRIVTIAAPERARADGLQWIAGALPDSARFRDAERGRLVDLAAAGELIVPVARTYPLAAAPDALRELAAGHPGGKLALLT